MYFVTGLHEEGRQFIRKRCFGYYPRKHQALQTIEGNCDELRDEACTHLVVEKILSGIYSAARDTAWFRYDGASSRWIRCERPESAGNYCQFSLG
ncbi:MAG: hypothetical protein GYA56_08525 [Geobacteraceae bacterium]|mgnify:CR=1 FL=1|nr:hypothetical protein [Geobacteraceae bacterium]